MAPWSRRWLGDINISSIESFNRLTAGELRQLDVFLATGFGSGFSPKMPGTVGTLVALPFWWFLFRELDFTSYLLLLLLLASACTVLVVRLCRRKALADDPSIVLDEFIGVWITLLGAPPTWQGLLGGFMLFRLFDIVKPWPVSWADRKVPGGLGVMLDDVFAGVLAALVLQLSVILFSDLFQLPGVYDP